jgi:type IV pilus assembly protein PilO
MNLSLSGIPWWGQVAAFGVVAVLSSGAFVYFYEMPAREEMVARQTELTNLRADIEKGQATARKLPQFRAQVTELEARLENLRAVLPEEKDAADLLNRMQSVAAQSSLTIKSFRPGATITKQMHAEWPITLELDGTYHNLATFFDRVGKFTRIVNITGLDVKGKDKPLPNSTITATCVATTFVLLDKPAAKGGAKPAPAAPGAKGA